MIGKGAVLNIFKFPEVFKQPYQGVRNSKEIIGIQALRFFAALLVVVDHYVIHYCELGGLPNSLLKFAYGLGHVGVCMFFAISGFVMVITNSSKFNNLFNALDFFIRRLIRIWPLYAIATIVFFVAKHQIDDVYNFTNLLKSLAFIPYLGEGGLYRPILGKGWTLNYEMFFYCIFTLCLFFPKKIGLSITVFVLALLPIVCIFFGFKGIYVTFYSDDIILFFLVGVLVALASNKFKGCPKYFESASQAVFVASIFLFIAIIVNQLQIARLVKDFTLTIIIFSALYAVCHYQTRYRSVVTAALIAVLGDSSYAIYLFHGFIFSPLKFLVLKNEYYFGNLVTLLILIFVAILFGAVIHLALEKPLQNHLLKVYREKLKLNLS
ncbi:MAG TPA: acyltransferase [Methylophilaceae bacterium]|jgi:exopolysaccharide production protein ExoZ